MADINTNLCSDEMCPDNQGPSMADNRHHHTVIKAGVDRVAVFNETHGGPMQLCGTEECRQVATRVDALSRAGETPPTEVHPTPEEERLNGVQNDLISQAAEIAEWWVKLAQADAERTVPKAVEYGAVDFDSMGLAMVALVRDKFIGADDAELMKVGREMAAMFYLNGKIGRALGAFQQGMLPSDDTLFDIAVYAMMWRRIRQTGSWIK